MPMCLLAKNREILAKSSPFNGLGGELVHTIICYVRRCAPLLFEELSESSSEKLIHLCKRDRLPLLEFFVHYRERVDRKFQVFARH
jgi:hypothetical protein